MLRIVNLEEIQGLLSETGRLVDSLEERSAGLEDDVGEWLERLEQVLENNRMPVVGEIAVLRAMLVAAGRGIPPESVLLPEHTSRRKLVEAAVAYILRQANGIVSAAIRHDVERYGEAGRMLRQLVALARAKGLLREVPSGESHQEALKALWAELAADPDLSGGIVNVEGCIGPHDAIIALDRTIARDMD